MSEREQEITLVVNLIQELCRDANIKIVENEGMFYAKPDGLDAEPLADVCTTLIEV